MKKLSFFHTPFFTIFQDRENGIILDNLVKLGYYCLLYTSDAADEL